MEQGSELVKYGPHRAILKNPGGGQLQLEMLIDRTFISVDSSGLSDDELLEFMDQKAVDALAAVLGN